jgi:hypothetical protein
MMVIYKFDKEKLFYRAEKQFSTEVKFVEKADFFI